MNYVADWSIKRMKGEVLRWVWNVKSPGNDAFDSQREMSDSRASGLLAVLWPRARLGMRSFGSWGPGRVLRSFTLLLVLTLKATASSEPDLTLPADQTPPTNSAVLFSGDLDLDGETDFTFERQSALEPREGVSYYSVVYFLRDTQHLKFIRNSPRVVDFGYQDAVVSESQIYTNYFKDNSVTLGAFDSAVLPGVQCYYYDVVKRVPTIFAGGRGFFTNKTEVLIGFRFTQLDSGTVHHGWLKLTRPDTLFITPFDLVALDWNPLPNEPIRAGLAPDIPLSFSVEEAGLRLTWPIQVSGWILETAERLGPDSEWLPVPDAVAVGVVVPLSDGTRFFRLRRP